MKPYALNKGWALFAIILTVNILQSVFSPLLNDEAYYWLYAQHPAWGYLDHPPMVALLIIIGKTILPGEIGVRLLGAVMGSFTFLLLYKLIESETEKPIDFRLAALLLFSSLFLNLYSFLAIPDTPMLFFAVLFLYTYRRYINSDTYINALALGVVTALLLYSKYHGVLLVSFTLISNPKVFLKPSFYCILLVALVLYSPHLYWQFQNDFPTIRFQFFQRAGVFKADHVFSYLGEQAAVTGPLALLIFSILYKPKNQFQKTLKYNVIGIFCFFLLSSFKEMINVHWTAIAFPAMICLAYLYLEGVKSKKFVTGILIVNLAAVLFLRINFAGNFLPLSNFNDKNPELMASTLGVKAKGHPLVFENMYNEPSYYMFYGHNDAFAVNDISYKKTQFNYLPQLEAQFQGKTVSLVTTGPINNTSEAIKIPKGKQYFVTVVPNFSSYSTGITISTSGFPDLSVNKPGSIMVTVENKLTARQIAEAARDTPYLQLTFTNNKTNIGYSYTYKKPFMKAGSTPFEFPFTAPAGPGDYSCTFSFMTVHSLYAGFNSNVYKFKVN